MHRLTGLEILEAGAFKSASKIKLLGYEEDVLVLSVHPRLHDMKGCNCCHSKLTLI